MSNRLRDIVRNPGKYKKAIAAAVVSVFSVAAVFGLADPGLEKGILAVLTALANVASVYKLTNA